jgi:CheY-like chemotaxis protein
LNGPGRLPVKCLIVDDLDENLIALEALLRNDSVTVLKARSGSEALEQLLQHDVALALIDVQMPDMDGFELAELMRGTERTRHVPIIFVTAGTRDQHRVFKGYDAGAVDFLYKPLEPRILAHKAQTFFELYRQRQVLADTLNLNEQLLAIVGHDLRDPLNVILMSAELLAGGPDAGVRKTAGRLSTAGGRMRSILDELFDLARARLGGGIPLTRQAVDLDRAQSGRRGAGDKSGPRDRSAERRRRVRQLGWRPARARVRKSDRQRGYARGAGRTHQCAAARRCGPRGGVRAQRGSRPVGHPAEPLRAVSRA